MCPRGPGRDIQVTKVKFSRANWEVVAILKTMTPVGNCLIHLLEFFNDECAKKTSHKDLGF